MKKNKEVKLDHMIIDDRADLLYKDEPPVELSKELQHELDDLFEEFVLKRRKIA